MKDISDDIDFCFKLAKEESVIILPGTSAYKKPIYLFCIRFCRIKAKYILFLVFAGIAVGLNNWLRITFAVEPSALEEAMERLKSFCQRHSY